MEIKKEYFVWLIIILLFIWIYLTWNKNNNDELNLIKKYQKQKQKQKNKKKNINDDNNKKTYHQIAPLMMDNNSQYNQINQNYQDNQNIIEMPGSTDYNIMRFSHQHNY